MVSSTDLQCSRADLLEQDLLRDWRQTVPSLLLVERCRDTDVSVTELPLAHLEAGGWT